MVMVADAVATLATDAVILTVAAEAIAAIANLNLPKKTTKNLFLYEEIFGRGELVSILCDLCAFSAYSVVLFVCHSNLVFFIK
jgi:hypothetical protein